MPRALSSDDDLPTRIARRGVGAPTSATDVVDPDVRLRRSPKLIHALVTHGADHRVQASGHAGPFQGHPRSVQWQSLRSPYNGNAISIILDHFLDLLLLD